MKTAYEVQIDPNTYDSDEAIINAYFFKRRDAVNFIIDEHEKLGVNISNRRKKFPDRFEVNHVAPNNKGGKARTIDTYIGRIQIK